MAKPDPAQLLEDIKTARTEAKRSKNAVVAYEQTSKTKTAAINKLLTNAKSQVDTVITELKGRFTHEGQSLKTAAKTETAEIEKIRKEAKDHYNRFNQTYNAATNKKNGVEAKHQRVLKFAGEAAANTHEIGKNATKAANDAEKIKTLLTNSRTKHKEIGDIYAHAEVVKQEIDDTYAITLDTTMAGTFKERRDSLKTRTELWEKVYLGSIASIILTVIVILLISRDHTFKQILTERLVFVTPLVVASFVFSRQFGHERKLYEEYAFKTAAAQALRGYTVLLNEQFKDDPRAKLRILNFTISTMSGIFDRDVLANNPTAFHFVFGHGLGKVEAKIEEVAQRAAKDIAQEIVDEAELVRDAADIPTPAATSS